VNFPGPVDIVWAYWLEDLSLLVDPARLVLLVVSSCLEDQKIDVVIVAVEFAAVATRKDYEPAAASPLSAAWDMENSSLVTFAFLPFLETTVVAVVVATVEMMPQGGHSPGSTPDNISNEDRQTDSEGVPRPAICNSLHDNRAGCAGNDDIPRRQIHRRKREILGAMAMVWKKKNLRNPPSSDLVVTDRKKKIFLVDRVVTVPKREIPLLCPVVAMIQEQKGQKKMPPWWWYHSRCSPSFEQVADALRPLPFPMPWDSDPIPAVIRTEAWMCPPFQRVPAFSSGAVAAFEDVDDVVGVAEM